MTEGRKELDCGCEIETRHFGTQVRLCTRHKHFATDAGLRNRPNFSAEHANDPLSRNRDWQPP